jgi:hypothetical protein
MPPALSLCSATRSSATVVSFSVSAGESKILTWHLQTAPGRVLAIRCAVEFPNRMVRSHPLLLSVSHIMPGPRPMIPCTFTGTHGSRHVVQGSRSLHHPKEEGVLLSSVSLALLCNGTRQKGRWLRDLPSTHSLIPKARGANQLACGSPRQHPRVALLPSCSSKAGRQGPTANKITPHAVMRRGCGGEPH